MSNYDKELNKEAKEIYDQLSNENKKLAEISDIKQILAYLENKDNELDDQLAKGQISEAEIADEISLDKDLEYVIEHAKVDGHFYVTDMLEEVLGLIALNTMDEEEIEELFEQDD